MSSQACAIGLPPTLWLRRMCLPCFSWSEQFSRLARLGRILLCGLALSMVPVPMSFQL